ncbi:response regulator transcription factor [Aliikangiella coralliicola]|nr:response regulator transcription factor [Aliikangiella coralliicola]
MKILIIDEDKALSNSIKPVLMRYNIRLDATACSTLGYKLLTQHTYNLLLIVLDSAAGIGLNLCQKIRTSTTHFKNIPIILLSSEKDLTDLIVGLEMGADDYLCKPVEQRELVARIRAAIRRSQDKASEQKIELGQQKIQLKIGHEFLFIDRVEAKLSLDAKPVKLTAMEFDLLALLANSPGAVYSRDEIIDSLVVQGGDFSRNIDALVYRIRKKFQQVSSKINLIRTVRSKGYSLVGKRIVSPPNFYLLKPGNENNGFIDKCTEN